MKLNRIKIEGFRNIKECEINLGSEITSLVSENSYGKSNLMTAIHFAITFIHNVPLGKTEMMRWRDGIPLNKQTDSHDFKADFFFETIFQDQPYEINYGFSFIWIKNASKSAINGEWLNARKIGPSQKFIKLINRSERALFKSSQTGRCSNVIRKISDNELILNKLLNLDHLYYMPLIEELNSVTVYVERHLDASQLYMKNPLILKNETEIDQMDFRDIPRTVYWLKEHYYNKYNLLIDAFVHLFPNIINFDVHEIPISHNFDTDVLEDAPYTISNKVYSIFVQDKNLNQPLDFSSMSDGAKRVFLMLTFAIIADIQKATLIAFEEPENSIHPALLQGYLRILTQLAGDCRIIIASHSPYILEYVPTENIYIGKPNLDGLANFKKIDTKKVNRLEIDASDNSSSVGRYIFELLSGSKDDIDILNTYLEK